MSSWEWQAAAWLRWARTPGHDSYWYFRDAFFDAIVPAPATALAARPGYERWQRLPNFLHLRAVKTA